MAKNKHTKIVHEIRSESDRQAILRWLRDHFVQLSEATEAIEGLPKELREASAGQYLYWTHAAKFIHHMIYEAEVMNVGKKVRTKRGGYHIQPESQGDEHWQK